MDRRFIVPVEPASGNGDVVVVEVQQEGSHPLDVQLVGCEGESAYVIHIKHREIGKLKNKFKGSDDEWEAILSHFLLHRLPVDHAKVLENVHLVYTLNKDETIELFIRQHVKGIKVTLGEISLPIEGELELDVFDWARVSSQNHLRTLQQLAALKSSASNEQDTVTKLKAQLDDFIKTKDQTEKEMLQQFMELLNEKKRKIRDQSRLLAGAKVDQTRASAIKSTRETTKPRKAAASRTTKRKAASKPPEPEPERLSDADQMDLDEAKAEAEHDNDSEPGAATPDRSEDETEDEDEPSAATSGSNTRVAQPPKDKSEEVSIPARRELPFGRPATRSKTPAAKPTLPVDGDDDTEDEEL